MGRAGDGGKGVRFVVKDDQKNGTPSIEGTVNRKGGTCAVCNSAVPFTHIRSEGKAGRMGQQLMAIVAEGHRGRKYMEATEEHITVAKKARPEWAPEHEFPHNPRDFKTPNYGMSTFADLFTPRQLVALGTFSDLVGEAQDLIRKDALASALSEERATAHADVVATYLGLAVSKLADASTTVTRWKPSMDQAIATFARQAIPMVWDYAESNIFNHAAGDYETTLSTMVRVLRSMRVKTPGSVQQKDATSLGNGSVPPIISSDPPYYDNIGYADLSDFFYVWLRRSLGGIYPEVFGTMLVPKSAELVATPYRFGGSKQKAQEFFESGLGAAFARMREQSNPNYPVTIYYAFKQAESEKPSANGGVGGDDYGVLAVASTGWETMLAGLMDAGFQITGTCPCARN